MPPLQQWSGKSEHQIYKVHYQKCIDPKSDIHIAFLQIRSKPLRSGLLSPAMLLFNHPIRVIVSIINRLPVNSNNNDDNYEVLIKDKCK